MATAQNFQIVISVLDKATAHLRLINQRVIALEKPFHGVSEAAGRFSAAAKLPQLAAAAQNVGRRFEDVVSHVRALLGPLAAVGALASFGGMAEMAKHAGEFGAQMVEASEKTGVAIEKIGGFHYLAQQSGVPIETMDKALERLNRTIGSTAAGHNKQAAEYFHAMHINLHNGNGTLKDASQLWGELADKFKNNTSMAEKTNAAMVLLGRGGADLLPVLDKGSAALDEQVAEYNRLHGALTKTQALGLKGMHELFLRLGVAMDGVQTSIGAALAPAITSVIGPLTNWMAANRQVISTKIGEWAKQLATTLLHMNWTKIGADALAFGHAIGSVLKFLGPMGTAIAGIGLVFGGLIKSIVMFGYSLIGLAIANPILTAIIVAVAAIAFAAYEIYEHWPQIKAFFVGLWDGVKAKFHQFMTWAGNTLSAWSSSVVKTVSGAWHGLLDFSKSLWADVVKIFEWAWAKIQPIVRPIVEAAEFLARQVANGAVATAQVETRAFAGLTRRPGSPLKDNSLYGAGSARNDGKVHVQVDLNGLPPGSKTKTNASGPAISGFDTGYAFAGGL